MPNTFIENETPRLSILGVCLSFELWDSADGRLGLDAALARRTAIGRDAVISPPKGQRKPAVALKRQARLSGGMGGSDHAAR